MSSKNKRFSVHGIFSKSTKENNSTRSTHDLRGHNGKRLTYVIPDDALIGTTSNFSQIQPLSKPKLNSHSSKENRQKSFALSEPLQTSSTPEPKPKPSAEMRIAGTPPSQKYKSLIPQNNKKEEEGDKNSNDMDFSTSTTHNAIPDNLRHQASLESINSDYGVNRNHTISSSIYAPTLVINNDFLNDTSRSQSVKRPELLKKRRPPPKLSDIREDNVVERINTELGNLPNPSTDKFSPLDTESQYSDLRINSSIDNVEDNMADLATEDNAPKIVMDLGKLKKSKFNKSLISNLNSDNLDKPDYEISSGFATHSPRVDTSHQHSRTLSSIEEMHQAIDSFQLSHNQSYYDEDHHSSFISEVETTTDTQGTKNEKLHLILEDENLDTNLSLNDFEMESKASPGKDDSLILKVKDLPLLEDGETIEEYVQKLEQGLSTSFVPSSPTEHSEFDNKKNKSPVENIYSTPRQPFEGFLQPSFPTFNTPATSETSSTDDIFFDVGSSTPVPNEYIIERSKTATEQKDFNEINTGDTLKELQKPRVHNDSFNELDDYEEAPPAYADENYLMLDQDEITLESNSVQSSNVNENLKDSEDEDHIDWQGYKNISDDDANDDVGDVDDNMDHSLDIPERPESRRTLNLDNEIENSFSVENLSELTGSRRMSDLLDEIEPVEVDSVNHYGSTQSFENLYPDNIDDEDEGDTDNHTEIISKVLFDDSNDSNSDGILEFSPKQPLSPRVFETGESDPNIDKYNDKFSWDTQPNLYRHNSMCSRNVLDQFDYGSDEYNDEPSQLIVINGDNNDFNDSEPVKYENFENKNLIPPVMNPELYGELNRESSSNTIVADINTPLEEPFESENRFEFYDRREEPSIEPIGHSNVITVAAPLLNKPLVSAKRPPPIFSASGRRSRGLSSTTTNPELFTSKTAEISKTSISATGFTGKGERSQYVESLRSNSTVISAKITSSVLPISLRSKAAHGHKKTTSQQLTFGSGTFSHLAPKTRMLASEINDNELPDAKLFHSGNKTKTPTHPDADVIAAGENFKTLAGKSIARVDSIRSVQPEVRKMKLYITNPDD